MSEKNDELTKLVAELMATTNQTLMGHAGALGRIKANLEAAHKTVSTHADAIQALRKDQLGLVELVNAQTRMISAIQACMLKVWTHLGMSEDGAPPAKVN